MKLLSIRLHPFGGSVDRQMTLHQGLNVLEGPNEFGKSTMVNGLWHALQTPSNLTPAKMRDTMGRWHPKPTGDHSRVTLRFEAEGKTWTLEKTWGTGSASRLQANGEAAIADPTKVQEKLRALLRLNAATWQQVLFTKQAELAATVRQLAEKRVDLDDVHHLLQGAAAIPGDIPAERLRTELDKRINEHFHRWDLQTQGPENGKGITNPWKNGLGQVIVAYYSKEALKAELNSVVDYERELDKKNTDIARLKEAWDKDASFIDGGRDLRDPLRKRNGLEERVSRLTGTVNQLKQIATEWPAAQSWLTVKDEEDTKLGSALEKLQDELKHARKRTQAQPLREGYKLLSKARAALEEARKELSEQPPVDPGTLQELLHLQKQVVKLRIQIEAQKLVARLECSGKRRVMLQRGTGVPEPVSLTPGQPWEGTAAGRLTVELDDLRLTVKSGLEDVDALFRKLQSHEQRSKELLDALGLNSLSKAEEAAKAYEKLQRDVESKEGLHEAALQGRTPEEWEHEVNALEQLPATRDETVLDKLLFDSNSEHSKLKTKLEDKRRQIEQWKLAHESVGKLMQKILELGDELGKAEQELKGLPALPAGFATVDDYLRRLTASENARDDVKKQLEKVQIERAGLEGAPPSRTAEDLRAELELKEREFQRCHAEGQALLRIRARLEHVIDRRGEDPLKGLSVAIAAQFEALTNGRYTGVWLEGPVPAQVKGAADLSTDILSQGTLGSLALATRLALAELYLKDDNGFLLLDDPFTDMDPARRTAAAKAIVDFARKCQVIILTCHPGHAQELKSVGGVDVLVP